MSGYDARFHRFGGALLAAAIFAVAGCDQAPPPSAQGQGASDAKPPQTAVNEAAATAADQVGVAQADATDTQTPGDAKPGPDAKAPDVDAPATKPTGNDNQPADALPAWPAPDQRYPYFLKFSFHNQDAEKVTLGDVVNRPTALSFLFTRCPDPQMCPMMAAQMASLQKTAKDAGLTDEIRLVFVSYDPTYDTPKRLRKFAEERGLNFSNAVMLQPAPAEFREMASEFGIRLSFDDKGNLNHASELYVIDHKGRLVRHYQGTWNNDMVLGDLKRLVTEQTAAKNP